MPAAAPAGDTGQTLTTDVQAALTVLGRLPSRDGVPRGDLTGARLAGAVLEKANLTGAMLYGANLTRTVLGGANLADADLTQQQLDSAHGDEDTKLPYWRQRPARWSAGLAAPPSADQ